MLAFCNTSIRPHRPEAVEVGGASRRLDPRPRREDAAQKEDHVQQEEDVRSTQGRRQQDTWEQEEEEVAAAVCLWIFKLIDTFNPVWPTRLHGLSLGCLGPPPTRWTGSKLGGNRQTDFGSYCPCTCTSTKIKVIHIF